ncbi:DNA-binding protein [Pseudostreptobacillus hongkongensis]|uniref:DNA-binding protein n=1 Tax=Pseudostreptobacillus hongkongensis TaxID=1162717 RepID=UPI0008331BEE|nr:DNA-binding protein [Pseudostreptobacillus hongkongensis]
MKEIEEYIRYSTLFIYYKNLFSDKQKKYLEAYLEEDNTITEIAEAFNVTRQAVFDNIKRGCKQLEKYEDLLGIMSRDERYLESLNKLKKNLSIENLNKLIEEFEEGVF